MKRGRAALCSSGAADGRLECMVFLGLGEFFFP